MPEVAPVITAFLDVLFEKDTLPGLIQGNHSAERSTNST